MTPATEEASKNIKIAKMTVARALANVGRGFAGQQAFHSDPRETTCFLLEQLAFE